jgi:PTH1 family peptidyl-tRNA hydrolase
MQKYRSQPADVWVIFDDVDVPFGRLRLRTGGQSGSGHQGVNSIIDHMGTNFVRVKVGISLNDRSKEPSEVYVLKPFTEAEQVHLPVLVPAAADIIGEQLRAGSPEDKTYDLI